MRILMVGDIVGKVGQEAVRMYLPPLKSKYKPDLVVVNGENAAPNGRGIKKSILRELLEQGADCITMGNHTWGQKEIFDFIDDQDNLIRPANFPEGSPGRGYVVLSTPKGKVTVVNLLGRTFMVPVDCPFQTIDRILEKVPPSVILVDFHAEATSEKLAFTWYLDGRVSAVVGTHTHVQTADERVLPKGTGYITDVGMVGPRDGIIGMEKEAVIKKFVTQLPTRFEVDKGKLQFHAVLIDCDTQTKKTKMVTRIQIHDDAPFFE